MSHQTTMREEELKNPKMTLLAILLVTAITGAATPSSPDPIREDLFASTNYWGRDVDRFLGQSNATVAMMRSRGLTSADKTALCDWYAVLLDLPVSTNSVAEYKAWLNVKASCLAGYSKRVLNPMYTNLWMKYASIYGDVRAGVRSSKTLLAEAKALFPADCTAKFDGDNVEVAMKKWLWKQSEWDAAREKALGMMWFGISEYIGARGISKLPAGVREEFLAEFERRARLNESERAQIRAVSERVR